MTNPAPNTFVQETLFPDEQLLWSGNSNVSFVQFVTARVRGALIYIILIVFIVAVVLAYNVPNSLQSAVLPIIMQIVFLIGAPVLSVVILYRLFQIYREYKQEQKTTSYAVTNQRILIRQNNAQFPAQLATLPGMIKVNHENDLGTIQFQVQGTPTFYRIKDVNKVYQLISEAQKTASE